MGDRSADRARVARDRFLLYAVAAVVTVVVLAPLVAPGYVLRYDMVFVPRQPLNWELVAPAQGLPRAVPIDAVVSVLTQLVPGWVVQRIALGGVILLAAVGAGRLVPTERIGVRLLAAVGYAWTPYLAERLLIGQWGLLVGYAALPWLVRAGLELRAGRAGAVPRVLLAAAPAAITPTGGLIAFGVVSLLAPQRGRWRESTVAVVGVALLNAPWVTAALVTEAGGTSDPAGVAAFAARGENWAGPLAALLGTGGIWSAQATPASRALPLVPLVTLVLLALAGAGFALLRRRLPPGASTRLLVLAGAGFLLAVLGAVPGTADVLRWAVAQLPGAGLLRDGQKFLAPYALLLVVCVALGAERLVTRVERTNREVAGVVLGGVLLLPVAAMPDLAFGGAGRLWPVSYPADWQVVAGRLADDPGGEVLVLPLSGYRAYPWNAGRTVLDPAPRYLPATVLIDDTLRVGDVAVTGENMRLREVRHLLGAGRPAVETGVRWVLVQQHRADQVDPATLTGLEVVHQGTFLALYRNPVVPPSSVVVSPARWAVVVAFAIAVAVVVAAMFRRYASGLLRGNLRSEVQTLEDWHA
ncbi:hypothetical protein [Salinispora fenicalii]|uniref:hypothetical protein n=1 Tax=Salinispora fenicalii TaxID=1137263 RepID=UPI000488E158|nr:hypothetical protein [Salinispora fenicalii]